MASIVTLEMAPSVEESVRRAVDTAQAIRGRGRGRGRGGTCVRGRGQAIQAQQATRKKNFFVAADLHLLRSILQHNPFEEGMTAWQAVANEVNKAFPTIKAHVRQVKERCMFLLKKLWQEQLEDINRTGTEIEWSERANLTQDVDDMKEAASILILSNEEMQNTRASPLPGTSRNEHTEATRERNAAAVAYEQHESEEDISSEGESGESTHRVNGNVRGQRTSNVRRNGGDTDRPARTSSIPQTTPNQVEHELVHGRVYARRKRANPPSEDWITKKAALELQIRKDKHDLKMQQHWAEMENKAVQWQVDADLKREQLRLESRRLDIEEARLAESTLQRLMFEQIMKK